MRAPGRSAGFNLIELLIVMAIAGILLAIGVPSMRDFVINTRRASTVNEMVALMQYARAEVVKRGGRMTICPSTNGTSCVASPTNWSAGWLLFWSPGTAAENCTVDLGDGELTPSTTPAAGKYVSNDNQGIDVFVHRKSDNAAQSCYHFRGFTYITASQDPFISVCDPYAAADATRRRRIELASGRTSITAGVGTCS
jgi:prepilin-type N-terminal cleavage/methylation domain-containing protein